MRWLVGSIRDWTALFAEAYRCCRPGDFVESYETSSILQSDDDTVKEDSAMGQWGKFFIEGSKKLGLSFTVVDDGTQRKAMEEAGFVDIEEYNFKVRNHAMVFLDAAVSCINRYDQICKLTVQH